MYYLVCVLVFESSCSCIQMSVITCCLPSHCARLPAVSWGYLHPCILYFLVYSSVPVACCIVMPAYGVCSLELFASICIVFSHKLCPSVQVVCCIVIPAYLGDYCIFCICLLYGVFYIMMPCFPVSDASWCLLYPLVLHSQMSVLSLYPD